jgi:hypothetical protein
MLRTFFTSIVRVLTIIVVNAILKMNSITTVYNLIVLNGGVVDHFCGFKSTSWRQKRSAWLALNDQTHE